MNPLHSMHARNPFLQILTAGVTCGGRYLSNCRPQTYIKWLLNTKWIGLVIHPWKWYILYSSVMRLWVHTQAIYRPIQVFGWLIPVWEAFYIFIKIFIIFFDFWVIFCYFCVKFHWQTVLKTKKRYYTLKPAKMACSLLVLLPGYRFDTAGMLAAEISPRSVFSKFTGLGLKPIRHSPVLFTCCVRNLGVCGFHHSTYHRECLIFNPN